MRLDVQCVSCNVRQMLKVMELENMPICQKEKAISCILEKLSKADYERPNPELLRDCWKIVRGEKGFFDPYSEIKKQSNKKISELIPLLKEELAKSQTPFLGALKYSIYGNMIDFAAFESVDYENFIGQIRQLEQKELLIDDSVALYQALGKASKCFFVADNCGEIVLDKLLIEQIKKEFPEIQIFYAVRGQAVINDVTRKEAESIGMQEYVTIIDSGDCMPGLIPELLRDKEKSIYNQCEVVISKGQGNFEGLSMEARKGIYYLLVAKCKVIQKELGIKDKGMVCVCKDSKIKIENEE